MAQGGAAMDGSYVLPSSSHAAIQRPTSSSSPCATTPVPASPVLASSSSRPPPPARPQDVNRRDRLQQAIDSRDVGQLKKMAAETGGFESSEMRRLAWPLLLGCSKPDKGKAVARENVAEGNPVDTADEPRPHQDERQVHLDILRSFISFPTDVSVAERDVLRTRLEKIIVTTLRRFPSLQYFQGYHDIITVLLLTFEDDELCQQAADRMSLHRLRDSMGSGLEPVMGYLRLVHRILSKVDADLAKAVEAAAELPYFSLSWVLTLMSHDLTSISVIARLFDFLLAHNPAMVSYLGVAIILLKKEELAELDQDSAEDPAVLHHTLSQLPNFVESPPPSTAHGTGNDDREDDEDEDLMSTLSRSPSTTTSASASFMTDSVMSLSSMQSSSSSLASTSTLDLSLDALDDSMLADPDVSGPAFSTPFVVKSVHSSRTTPSPPPATATATAAGHSGRLQQSPTVSIDAIIARTLELYESHPLVNPDSAHGGAAAIAADEVMGPKSCVFTWPLSQEGLLTDDEASEIVRAGVEIVLPPPPLGTDEKELSEERLEEKGQGRSRRIKRTRTDEERMRRKREIGMGAALAVVGVAGVLLAVYGSQVKDWQSVRRWWWWSG